MPNRRVAWAGIISIIVLLGGCGGDTALEAGAITAETMPAPMFPDSMPFSDEIPELQQQQIIQGAAFNAFAWSNDSVNLVALSVQDKAAASTVQIWDGLNAQSFIAMTPDLEPLEQPLAIAWAPDSSRIVALYGAPELRIHILDSQTLAETAAWDAGMPAESGALDSLIALSPSGDAIATISSATTTIWTMNGSVLLELPNPDSQNRAIAWSPDGLLLATSDSSGTARIWNSQSGVLMQTIAAHSAPADGLAWSDDSATLVTGGHDSTVTLWDAQTGALLQTIPARPAPANQIITLDWRPFSSALAILTSDATITIWDTATNTVHQEFSVPGAQSLAWSADGTRLAILGGEETRTITVWGE